MDLGWMLFCWDWRLQKRPGRWGFSSLKILQLVVDSWIFYPIYMRAPNIIMCFASFRVVIAGRISSHGKKGKLMRKRIPRMRARHLWCWNFRTPNKSCRSSESTNVMISDGNLESKKIYQVVLVVYWKQWGNHPSQPKAVDPGPVSDM